MSAPPVDLVAPEWFAAPLAHNPRNGATGGIWRVERDDGPAVLKILTPPEILTPPDRRDVPAHWATSADPGHWNYWLREALAYREGLAYPGIRAPRLREWVDRPDGSVAVWLEYIPGEPVVARLGEFAERLGAGHAAWWWSLRDDPEHGRPWFARDWLADYTTTRPVTEPLAWEHPTAVAAWPGELRAGLRELWASRHAVLAATRTLPQTLCHHDVWPMNLRYDGTDPVLLDWSFVGPGPVGEDAANLILDTFFDGLVDVSLLDEVVDAVTAGYTRGLAGTVDAGTVGRAIRLTGAAKYFWLGPRMVDQLGVPASGASYDTRGVADMFAGRRRPLELVAAWFEETRDLLPQ